MRVLFAGTPSYSTYPLAALHSEFDVCAVLTTPDRPIGRRHLLTASPIKQKALDLGIPVLQPDNIDTSLHDGVVELEPELLVVASFHEIFKQSFISLFPSGGINLHPSLLPKLRGPSPVQSVILSGDRKSGVTVQRLARRMDAGDILAQEEIQLSGDETAPELLDLSFEVGARLIVDVIRGLESGKLQGSAQSDEDATYCRLIKKEDGRIDWSSDAQHINGMVRAYMPWPGAFSTYEGRQLSLVRVGLPDRDRLSIEPDSDGNPGFVFGVDKQHGILVHTGSGVLSIQELQLEAKRSMAWQDFLNGHRELIGSQLGGC